MGFSVQRLRGFGVLTQFLCSLKMFSWVWDSGARLATSFSTSPYSHEWQESWWQGNSHVSSFGRLGFEDWYQQCRFVARSGRASADPAACVLGRLAAATAETWVTIVTGLGSNTLLCGSSKLGAAATTLGSSSNFGGGDGEVSSDNNSFGEGGDEVSGEEINGDNNNFGGGSGGINGGNNKLRWRQ